MIPDLLDSIVRPNAYRRFAAENAARTASYIAFLSLIFLGGLGIAVKLRLTPLFDETFVWLETQMPPLQFTGGTVTSTVPGPTRLEHPRAKELALIIDTARKDLITPQMMTDAKVVAYLTGNALYLERGGGQIETIDLSKSASDRPITVDASSYKEMEQAFDWIFYPALMLFFFLTFALSLALCGALYALAGMILASAAGGTLGFKALFRVGVHAQTAGSLLYALDAILPRTLPYFQAVSMALSMTLLWLGVRAAVKGEHEKTAAPAA